MTSDDNFMNLPALAGLFHIKIYPGYLGAFTKDQAEGAIPNGTRIVKTTDEDGKDITPAGTVGTVLGSFILDDQHPIFYFVEWEDKPKLAVGVAASKIARLS